MKKTALLFETCYSHHQRWQELFDLYDIGLSVVPMRLDLQEDVQMPLPDPTVILLTVAPSCCSITAKVQRIRAAYPFSPVLVAFNRGEPVTGEAAWRDEVSAHEDIFLNLTCLLKSIKEISSGKKPA